MFLAEKAAVSTFTPFDIFMVVFTILLVVGLARLFMQRPRRSIFAIGFTIVALLVFIIADIKMISGW